MEKELFHDYHVLIKNGDLILANSNYGPISQKDIGMATSFVLTDNIHEQEFSSIINANGGMNAIGSKATISRSEAMQLLGGQENYNFLLKEQGLSSPEYITNSYGQFIVYPDGEIYKVGSLEPLKQSEISAYWPQVETDTRAPQHSEPTEQKTPPTESSGGGNQRTSSTERHKTESKQQREKEKAKSSTNSTPSSTDESEEQKNRVTEATSNVVNTSSNAATSGSTIKINYSALSERASSLDTALASLDASLKDFQSNMASLNNITDWQGEDKELFLEACNNDYVTYLQNTAEEAKKLKEQILNTISAFESAEQRILGLSI